MPSDEAGNEGRDRTYPRELIEKGGQTVAMNSETPPTTETPPPPPPPAAKD